MSKILLNEKYFRKLSFSLEKKEEIFAVGFYGDFKKSLQAAYLYLADKMGAKEYHFKEGVLVLRKDDKLAIIYKAMNNSLFNYKEKAGNLDSSHKVSTYIRYLIDLCPTIIISPPDDFVLNPDMSNPFDDDINPGFELTEEIVIPK